MTGCVILAAGLSRRFGKGNKLLAEVGGRPMLDGVLDAVSALDGIAAVGVASQDSAVTRIRQRGIPVAFNPTPESGISGSIRIGLMALMAQWELTACLFAVADQPFLTATSLRAMLQQHQAQPDKIIALAYQGKRGNPVLFPADCFPALLALQGDTGGSAILREQPQRLWLCSAASEKELWDIDTVQALPEREEK